MQFSPVVLSRVSLPALSLVGVLAFAGVAGAQAHDSHAARPQVSTPARAVDSHAAQAGTVVSAAVADAHAAHPDAAADAHAAPHWTYEGPNGPEHWADLSPEFATCSTGRAQSPIDIRTSIRGGSQALRTDYHTSPLRLINNGHTIQVNYAGGSFLEIGRERYELLQMHFHTPSENKVEGRAYDMEAHLVHRNSYGELAVLAVFLTRGAENAFLARVWEHLPTVEGSEQAYPQVVIDAAEILPANREYFAFTGSLTTPPCSEGVRWNVLHVPVEISDAQYRAFANLFPNDARPVQPLNGRKVVDVH